MSGMLNLTKRLIFTTAAIAFAVRPAVAQDNAVGAIGNLFGALAQAGAKAKAQKGWAQVNPQTTQCVNTMFSSKNVTVDQLIEAGLAPNDKRLAPIMNACNAFLTAQLRTNFPCTVTNAKAEQVETTCNESFAKEVDGALVPISGDEVILAAANGEKVSAGNFETEEAQQARLASEQRQAAVERQKFATSPEGKRQAAANAALAAKKRQVFRYVDCVNYAQFQSGISSSLNDAGSFRYWKGIAGRLEGKMLSLAQSIAMPESEIQQYLENVSNPDIRSARRKTDADLLKWTDSKNRTCRAATGEKF